MQWTWRKPRRGLVMAMEVKRLGAGVYDGRRGNGQPLGVPKVLLLVLLLLLLLQLR